MHPALPPALRFARSTRPRRYAAVALSLLTGLSLAACGSTSSHSPLAAPGDTRPASQPTQGGKTLAALWPLTGLPAPKQTPRHPVMVVKIDNTPSSNPQLGLAKADMITEELVEGGITRLAVIFYSHVPGLVGPVRSMRASDIGVVKPTHGVLICSGGAPPTVRLLTRKHVHFLTEGAPGYFRDYSRIAPYNLFVHLKQLAKTLRKSSVVPASYLPWGSEKRFTGVAKAKQIGVTFSTTHTTMWSYSHGLYTNTNSEAAPNAQFHPSTVLVLRVHEGNAGYLDPAGHTVPETIFHGTGDMLMFHHGMVERGTWHKRGLTAPIQLATKSGPLTVPAGHVWIELDPVGSAGGSVTWRK